MKLNVKYSTYMYLLFWDRYYRGTCFIPSDVGYQHGGKRKCKLTVVCLWCLMIVYPIPHTYIYIHLLFFYCKIRSSMQQVTSCTPVRLYPYSLYLWKHTKTLELFGFCHHSTLSFVYTKHQTYRDHSTKRM